MTVVKVTVVLVTVVTVEIVTVVLLSVVNKKREKYIYIYIYFLSTFGQSNLTYLTTDVMFSGQRFAILAIFFLQSCYGQRGC